jgi:hypothetical protein
MGQRGGSVVMWKVSLEVALTDDERVNASQQIVKSRRGRSSRRDYAVFGGTILR